jgi:hypothetical protein
MCVWNIPPGKELLPHVDSLEYHFKIIRNIFIVSDHSSSVNTITINDKDVEFAQGTLFQFSPSIEKHAFKNSSGSPFYFLGYDFWIPAELSENLSKFDNLEELFNDNDRHTQYGTPKRKKQKYMSRH